MTSAAHLRHLRKRLYLSPEGMAQALKLRLQTYHLAESGEIEVPESSRSWVDKKIIQYREALSVAERQ